MKGWWETLTGYFQDSDVSEVVVNGIRSMVVYRTSFSSVHSSVFRTHQFMLSALQDFAFHSGARLDPFQPSAGGVSIEGSYRWHCIVPPASGDEVIFSLRRHRFQSLKFSDFEISRAILEEVIDVLKMREHILICGPTGSGKTSLLMALLGRYFLSERIVLIEDISELPLMSPTWVKLVAKKPGIGGNGAVDFNSLFESCLRIRPDRIVVGELRSIDEMRTFLHAISSGHGSVISTIHSANIHDVLTRFWVQSSSSASELAGLANSDALGSVLEKVQCLFLSRSQNGGYAATSLQRLQLSAP